MAVLFEKKHRSGRSALCVLLVLCLVLSPLSIGGLAARAADTQEFQVGVNEGSVKAVLTRDGVLTISGVGETKDYTPDTAPFAGLNVTSVVIRGGISSLGDYLFYGCGSLGGELILPDGIASLGEKVFSGSSAANAAKFTFIRNNFTQCTITGENLPEEDEETEKTEEEQLPGDEEKTESQAPQTAEENEEQNGEASESSGEPEGNENTQEPPVQEETPAESEGKEDPAAPTETAQETTPGAAGSEAPQKKYTVTKITQQRVGAEPFFPGSGAAGMFVCSEENHAFSDAALQAGYRKADRVIGVTLVNDEDDATVTDEALVFDGTVILPSLPESFFAPADEVLYTYAFAGWVESRDQAGVVNPAGSSYPVEGKDSLYFHAVWEKRYLVRLQAERTKTTLTLTVPEISGYKVTDIVWQIAEVPGGVIPGDEETLAWEELPEERGNAVYTRRTQRGDENRAIRCLVTLQKTGGFSFFGLKAASGGEVMPLAAVPAAQALAAPNQIAFDEGEYTDDPLVIISGQMDPISAGATGAAIAPECAFTAAGGASPVVFCGWTTDGIDHVDPGDLVPQGTTLTAKWGVPAKVIYVGVSPEGEGTEASPCSLTKAFTLLGSSTETSGPEAVYKNVLVVKESTTAASAWPAAYTVPFTLTGRAPGETSAPSGVVLSLTKTVSLNSSVRMEYLSLSDGEAIYARGNRLTVGQGVTAADPVDLFGGDDTANVTGGADVRVFSGTWGNISGGGDTGTVTGTAKVIFGGATAVAANVTGGNAGQTAVTVFGGSVQQSVFGGSSANTEVTIRDYTGSFQSIQQAAVVKVLASTLQLTGAEPAETTLQDSQQYALVQVGDLRLAGSSLRLDKGAKELGAVGNYTISNETLTSSMTEAGCSTLQLAPGGKLTVMSDGIYGLVSGKLALDVTVQGTATEADSVMVEANAGSPGAVIKTTTGAGKDLSFTSESQGGYQFWRLGDGSARVEATIQALHQGSGFATAEAAVSLTASEDGAVFVLAQRQIRGGFTLIQPQEASGTGDLSLTFGSGQNAGNTFGLKVRPTGADWTNPGSGAYILTAEPGISRLSAGHPSIAEEGQDGEVTLTLVYDSGYTLFTGGTVDLTFKEYAAGADITVDEPLSVTVVAVTLEGDPNGIHWETYAAAGRVFEDLSGVTGTPAITGKSAVSGHFISQYTPPAGEGRETSLSLYQVNTANGTRTAVSFPAKTKVILADLSTAGAYQYYKLELASAQSKLVLTSFVSMKNNTTPYALPVGGAGQVTEKLLLIVDFSGVTGTKGIDAGSYDLRLAHSATETEMETASFTVVSEMPTIESQIASIGDNVYTLTIASSVPQQDTRFAAGAFLRIALLDSTMVQAQVLPSQILFGGVEGLVRNDDGTLTVPVLRNSNITISFDCSQVPQGAMTAGLLRIDLHAGAGLQVASNEGTQMLRNQQSSFPYVDNGNEVSSPRAISVQLTSGERIMSAAARTTEAQRRLVFSVNYTWNSGDSIRVAFQQKIKNEQTGESHYEDLPSGRLPSGKQFAVSLTNSSRTATVTASEATPPGTYRILFRVVGPSGDVVAEEPFNIIIKE